MATGDLLGGSVFPEPLTVGQILRVYGPQYRQQFPLTAQQDKVLRALSLCRTPALGGHLWVCTECGQSRPAYNSCRDRHCPLCQSLRQAEWIEQRRENLLPVPYFHVVFTLPAELRSLCFVNQEALYTLLFDSAAKTLQRLGKDPKRLGARLSFTSVLHTWTRTLQYHPHLHCIVTAGGLSPDGASWVSGSPKYLFPVRVMGQLFRGLFLSALQALEERGELQTQGRSLQSLLGRLYRKRWVVYAKPPFAGPEQVFAYLGRYTHRVGISNQRLLWMRDGKVCFLTKNGQRATLAAEEFVRRFLMHVLPYGFVKLRHYGLWASGNAKQLLAAARALLQAPGEGAASRTAPPLTSDPEAASQDTAEDLQVAAVGLLGIDVRTCPSCHKPTMQRRALPQAQVPEGPRRLDTS